MPSTTLSVAVDRTEYSPYYTPVSKITCFVKTSGADPGAVASVTLFREDGWGAVNVTAKTGVIVGNAVSIVFDLESADRYDVDGILRTILGNYHINATVSDNVALTAKSATFRIAPVSVAELRATTLRGVELTSSTVVRPRMQPKNITGVTIVDVSTSARHDIFVLAYTAVGALLSWDGGAGVPVATAGINRYLLLSFDTTWWVEVEVVGEMLPVGNQTDAVVMDYQRLDDTDLQQIADNVYGTLQASVQVALEPRELNSDPPGSELNTGEHIDQIMEPLAYYSSNFSSTKNWFSIKFPTSNILKVWRIDGFFNSSRAFQVQVADWVVKNGKSGLVEFVPRYGTVLLFRFFGVPWLIFVDREHIPSFWHFRLTAGLRDMDQHKDRQRMRMALARWITVETLVIAGQMSSPGIMGSSVSRDGVSESLTYVQGKGGRYGSQIDFHAGFLWGEPGQRGELDRLRDKFVGVMMVTL